VPDDFDLQVRQKGHEKIAYRSSGVSEPAAIWYAYRGLKAYARHSEEKEVTVEISYNGVRPDEFLELNVLGACQSFGPGAAELRIWKERKIEEVEVSGREEPSGATKVIKLSLKGKIGDILPLLKDLFRFLPQKT